MVMTSVDDAELRLVTVSDSRRDHEPSWLITWIHGYQGSSPLAVASLTRLALRQDFFSMCPAFDTRSGS